MGSQGHKAWFIALVVLNMVTMLVQLLVSFINSARPAWAEDVFQHTLVNQSEKYYLEITPAPWTFSLWNVVYVWQLVWVVYSLVNLCRSTPEGPVCLCPVMLPPALFVLFILTNACLIAWLFLFDRDLIGGALAAQLGMALLLIACVVLSYRAFKAVLARLAEKKRRADIWLVRILVHNGLGGYAAWSCFGSLLSLAVVLAYGSESVTSTKAACTVALSLLFMEIIAFFIADLVFLDRYSRYVITPYVVIVVALGGSVAKNWEEGARNSVLTVVLLAVGLAGLVVKVILMIYRHLKLGPYPTTVINSDPHGQEKA